MSPELAAAYEEKRKKAAAEIAAESTKIIIDSAEGKTNKKEEKLPKWMKHRGVIWEIRMEHPEWSQKKIAEEASRKVGECITQSDVSRSLNERM